VSLFAEIAGTASEHPQDSMRAVRAELIAHLERLCAVRRGSLLLTRDYGVHDVTHLFHSFPGGMEGWCEELTDSLVRYEPRLRDVRVNPVVSDHLDLTFRVEIFASLIVGDRTVPVQFSARIDPHRNWSVK